MAHGGTLWLVRAINACPGRIAQEYTGLDVNPGPDLAVLNVRNRVMGH